MRERPDEESRAGEQHDSERDLREYQEPPRPVSRGAGDRTGGARRKAVLDIHAARLQRRRGSEDDARNQGQHRSGADGAEVQGDRMRSGERVLSESPETLESERTKQNSHKAPDRRQDDALHQQLTHHGGASAAKRHARGELACAARRPREQQSCEVDAGHEQHDGDRDP